MPTDVNALLEAAAEVEPSLAGMLDGDDFGIPDTDATAGTDSVKMSEPIGKTKSAAKAARNAMAEKLADKPLPPKRKGQFVKPLEQLYVGVGMSLILIDPTCAAAIMNSANKCAVSIDELAYVNPQVRRIVAALLDTSAIGAVVFAHMPIMLAVVLHHVPGVADTPLGAMAAMMTQTPPETDNASEDG